MVPIANSSSHITKPGSVGLLIVMSRRLMARFSGPTSWQETPHVRYNPCLITNQALEGDEAWAVNLEGSFRPVTKQNDNGLELGI